MKKKIIIGTRESRLAMIQSQIVKAYIEKTNPEIEAELLPLKTTGDTILDRTLDQIGGKGLFVKELDQALLDGRSDISVHSLKDVPMELPEALPLVGFSKREDPRDVLVLPDGCTEPDPKLPIGCSGPRRVLQIKELFPGYAIKPVRGNVLTRLQKLEEGQYGALVLAAAGLKRLGLEHRIYRYFTPDEMIPAAGQGILAVQGRRGEDRAWLSGFTSEESRLAAQAERTFVRILQGGCSSPIAAYGEMEGGNLRLRGLYFDERSGKWTKGELTGPADQAVSLGETLARELKEKLEQEGKAQKTSLGKVWLVGAGPGDPGLLTRKGKSVLDQADVVVYDSLVGPGILAEIPKTAEVIYVGKRASHHTMEQEEINHILLEKAKAGLQVVRLKGGDPFLFGRGGEELELLTEENIPYEVVPGITAPLAVPAYCGIPVTHRDYSSSLHIVTGHRKADQTYDIDFESLVKVGGTLVFLMGVTSLPFLCKGLLDAGMDKDMPAALLERGTTAEQRCILATVSTLEEEVRRQGRHTPALILVGKVCKLAQKFSWWENMPLAGTRILSVRPKNRPSVMTEKLRKLGAEVIEIPSIETKGKEDQSRLYKAFQIWDQYQWLVFTSPYGVEVFFSVWKESGRDIRSLGSVKIAAIGAATERAVRDRGLFADLVPPVYDSEHLGKALTEVCEEGSRILLARAEDGSPELLQTLKETNKFLVDDIGIYQTTEQTQEAVDVERLLREEKISCVAFTSASTVRGLVHWAPRGDFSRVKAVCIGAQTGACARRYGMKVYMAEEASLESMTQRICQLKEESEI